MGGGLDLDEPLSLLAVFARFFLGTSLLADDASSWLLRTMTTGGFVAASAAGEFAAAPDIVLKSAMSGGCWRYFGNQILLQAIAIGLAIAIIYCYSDERQKNTRLLAPKLKFILSFFWENLRTDQRHQ